jgi:hypothetical protein
MRSINMNRKIYHVTPAAGGWRVKREHAGRADSVHGRKAPALARAKWLVRRAALGQVKVHGKDGEIQMEYTYGKDPRRSPG